MVVSTPDLFTNSSDASAGALKAKTATREEQRRPAFNMIIYLINLILVTKKPNLADRQHQIPLEDATMLRALIAALGLGVETRIAQPVAGLHHANG